MSRRALSKGLEVLELKEIVVSVLRTLTASIVALEVREFGGDRKTLRFVCEFDT